MQERPPIPDLEPALLTPERLLAWRRATTGRSDDFPPDFLLTHQPSLFRALAPRFRRHRLTGLATPVAAIEHGRVGIALTAIGAPATAMLVDELAARGVRRVIAVDVCASIEPLLPSASLLTVESAGCRDGTSPHYAPGCSTVEPEAALLEEIQGALAGASVAHRGARVWSTDAPYRETPSLLQRAREAGATAIDMETSALYAAGAATGVSCAALLVTADRLLDDWQPPSDMALVNVLLRRAAEVTLGVLRS